MPTTKHPMTIDVECAITACPIDAEQMRLWATQTLQCLTPGCDFELAVRVVDEIEGRHLNATFRQKDYPTNVLSFPADMTLPDGPQILGDIALCFPVITAEATAQNKRIDAHCAHLIVHGILHLLGYDHQTEAEATEMERQEIGILEKLGYANPYRSEDISPT